MLATAKNCDGIDKEQRNKQEHHRLGWGGEVHSVLCKLRRRADDFVLWGGDKEHACIDQLIN